MRAGRAAAACWIGAGVAYVAVEAVAAQAFPGYDYAHDFISDLGRPDSPLSPLMNAAFVVQGTLFFVGAALVARAGRRPSRRFVALAALNAVGNVAVASVPSGSAGIAWVHVTGAVCAIVGGNLAILAGAPSMNSPGAPRYYRPTSVGLAGLGLFGFALLAAASTTSASPPLPAAVLERTSVYTIIAWQMLSGVCLLRRPMDCRGEAVRRPAPGAEAGAAGAP